MHYTLAVVIAVASLLASPASAGTIFKCKSAQGELLYQEKPCADENKSLASWGSASGAPLVMNQGNNGHYYVDGLVNEQKLNFVIDTGASLVSLPQELANSAMLICKRQIMTQTANGLSTSCVTTIKTLKFGTFTLTNVDALISPNLAQPLLGMNVLKQFRIEQDSGVMRLLTK